jgi:hypothetical protein
MSDADEHEFEVTGKVGLWPSSKADGGWHYLVVKGQTAMEIRYAALGRTGGFGSIKVRARIGGTEWQTSLFPHRDSGGFIILLKAEVRRREGVTAGKKVTLRLAL